MFAFDTNRRYRATFDPDAIPVENLASEGRRLTRAALDFTIPRPDAEPTTFVAAVFPTADLLPENLLRVYIHLSAPMSMGDPLPYFHLLDESGAEVPEVFLPLGQELWNGDRTRFTLFFDPGRVKRGIDLNEALGRAILDGGRYTLLVDADWKDAQGLPLREAHRKTFSVGPPIERAIDTDEWRIEAPAAGSREPLRVAFPAPLDRALALRALSVRASGGDPISGESQLDAAETQWSFVPDAAWPETGCELIALTFLEDPAGNRIGAPFEVDAFSEIPIAPEVDSIAIPFLPRSPRH
jgi:hypothetical protein